VRQGHEMLTHYFLCLGGTGTDSTKSTSGNITPNLCFACSRICGSRCAFQCVCDTKHRRITFMLRWDRYGFHKERTRKHYTKLVFLHRVESTGHVVHSVASAVPKCRRAIFYALVRPVWIPQKEHRDTLR
jgi:hypothetical protein